jgi:hypothetical protein
MAVICDTRELNTRTHGRDISLPAGQCPHGHGPTQASPGITTRDDLAHRGDRASHGGEPAASDPGLVRGILSQAAELGRQPSFRADAILLLSKVLIVVELKLVRPAIRRRR